MRIWFVRKQIFPGRTKVKAGSINYKKIQKWRRKQARQALKKQQKAEKKKQSADEKGSTPGFKEKSFARSFSKHLIVRIVSFKISVGSDDAARTAILYGTIAQSIAYILELLRHAFRLKLKQGEEVEVRADYVSDTIQAELYTAFTLRIWHAFAILFAVAGTYLKSKSNQKTNDPPKTIRADQVHTQAS